MISGVRSEATEETPLGSVYLPSHQRLERSWGPTARFPGTQK